MHNKYEKYSEFQTLDSVPLMNSRFNSVLKTLKTILDFETYMRLLHYRPRKKFLMKKKVEGKK